MDYKTALLINLLSAQNNEKHWTVSSVENLKAYAARKAQGRDILQELENERMIEIKNRIIYVTSAGAQTIRLYSEDVE